MSNTKNCHYWTQKGEAVAIQSNKLHFYTRINRWQINSELVLRFADILIDRLK